MKNTAVRAAAVVAAALFATTATACSNSGSSSHEKEDTSANVKEAAASPSASVSPGAKDSAAKIMTSNANGLGEILVDGQGNTLYLFLKDTGDTSTCTGSCAKQWPPAIVSATPKPAMANESASPSVSASPTSTATGTASPSPTTTASPSPTSTGGMIRADLLGTTKRSDGTLQATYNKHPLYYFVGDTKAGQTNGQGLNFFGARWYVVDPQGNSITKSAPKSTNSPSGASSGGTQY